MNSQHEAVLTNFVVVMKKAANITLLTVVFTQGRRGVREVPLHRTSGALADQKTGSLSVHGEEGPAKFIIWGIA